VIQMVIPRPKAAFLNTTDRQSLYMSLARDFCGCRVWIGITRPEAASWEENMRYADWKTTRFLPSRAIL
jgi:hypothetical protein